MDLAFDQQVWTEVSWFGWGQLLAVAFGVLMFGSMGVVLVLASASAAVSAGVSLAERAVSVCIAVAVGAALWACGRTVYSSVTSDLSGFGDDFTSVRIEGQELAVQHVWQGEVARFPATDLQGIDILCEPIEDASEQTWSCERTVTLRLADGRTLRDHDHIPWGLSPCQGAADPWKAHGVALLALAGRARALSTTGCDGSPSWF